MHQYGEACQAGPHGGESPTDAGGDRWLWFAVTLGQLPVGQAFADLGEEHAARVGIQTVQCAVQEQGEFGQLDVVQPTGGTLDVRGYLVQLVCEVRGHGDGGDALGGGVPARGGDGAPVGDGGGQGPQFVERPDRVDTVDELSQGFVGSVLDLLPSQGDGGVGGGAEGDRPEDAEGLAPRILAPLTEVPEIAARHGVPVSARLYVQGIRCATGIGLELSIGSFHVGVGEAAVSASRS